MCYLMKKALVCFYFCERTFFPKPFVSSKFLIISRKCHENYFFFFYKHINIVIQTPWLNKYKNLQCKFFWKKGDIFALSHKKILKLVFFFCEWGFSTTTCYKEICHESKWMPQKWFKLAIFLKKYGNTARVEKTWSTKNS